MASTQPAAAAPEGYPKRVYRLTLAVTALCLFGALALALAWHCGLHALYFDALGLFGFEPFRFPFLDIHAVLAAAQCQRAGIDVYLYNPCDVLGRPHVYSPLWLLLTPSFLDTTATTSVGLALDLMFILSLAIAIRPVSWGETLAIGLVALSPMTIYALERANCDLVVFLLILAGFALDPAPRRWRLGCYAFYLTAGLLKYYPLVLLVLLARERRRDGLFIAGLSAAAVIFLVIRGHAELAKALANIPALSYFADSFSARNLPFGFVEVVFGPHLRIPAALLLLSIVLALAIARTRRTFHMLDAVAPHPNLLETQRLLVGALLLTTCFLLGQNIDYRGIYFILVMPGLVRLCQSDRDPAIRRFLARMIAAVLFVAWEEPLRRALHMIAPTIAADWLRPRIELLFWIGRELVWWWLIAGLAAIVLTQLLRMPRVLEISVYLRRLWPAREQRRQVPG
jgi:hypothetical protein